MSTDQIEKINALKRCKLPPGFARRFVCDMLGWSITDPKRELTDKQARYLDDLVHKYRGQIPVEHKKLCRCKEATRERQAMPLFLR